MASINGISLKHITFFRDHEGDTIAQANVYKGNRKVGFWTQDTGGGADVFLDCYDAVQKAAHDFAEGSNRGNIYEATKMELFMCCLLDLTEEEKVYRHNMKAGHAHMLYATDGYHCLSWAFADRQACEDAARDEKIQKEIEAVMDKDGINRRKYTVHSIEDYNVTVNADNPPQACACWWQ